LAAQPFPELSPSRVRAYLVRKLYELMTTVPCLEDAIFVRIPDYARGRIFRCPDAVNNPLKDCRVPILLWQVVF